jgi:glutaredoxin-like protein NrdH
MRMKTTKVQGKNNTHKVLLYAISTCAWCRKAKSFLEDNSIEFEYIYVDLCSEKDREEVYRDIEGRGGRSSFPIVIVDDKTLINGFHEDRIREAAEI